MVRNILETFRDMRGRTGKTVTKHHFQIFILGKISHGSIVTFLDAFITHIKKPKVNSKTKLQLINALPTIEKILEIAAYKQEYFGNNKLIIKEQSGFRNKYSCETALQMLIPNLKNAIDKGKTDSMCLKLLIENY